jgi:hypothetical protein
MSVLVQFWYFGSKGRVYPAFINTRSADVMQIDVMATSIKLPRSLSPSSIECITKCALRLYFGTKMVDALLSYLYRIDIMQRTVYSEQRRKLAGSIATNVACAIILCPSLQDLQEIIRATKQIRASHAHIPFSTVLDLPTRLNFDLNTTIYTPANNNEHAGGQSNLDPLKNYVVDGIKKVINTLVIPAITNVTAPSPV